jgi:hypothetical protein
MLKSRRPRPFSIFILVLLFVLSFQTQASSDSETLGTFRFRDFSLAPRLEVREPSEGGFELKESWISVQWIKDESIHGQFRLGTADQIQPIIWMNPSRETFSLLEAWVELRSEYGKVRVGRIPLADGFEGSFGDGFWLMPLSEVRKRNWLFSRDEGLTWEASTKPWLTSITVHNGESGANADNKMWVTGRWQFFANDTGNGILLTASEGATNPVSTSTSTAASSEGFKFDGTKSSKVRWGTLSFFHLWKRDYWNLEVGRGDNLQDPEKYPFAWGRLDFSWNLGGDLNLLARLEQTQSDLKDAGTASKIAGLGFVLSSRDQLSSLTLFFKRKEESIQRNNDEALLLFRINSTSAGN